MKFEGCTRPGLMQLGAGFYDEYSTGCCKPISNVVPKIMMIATEVCLYSRHLKIETESLLPVAIEKARALPKWNSLLQAFGQLHFLGSGIRTRNARHSVYEAWIIVDRLLPPQPSDKLGTFLAGERSLSHCPISRRGILLALTFIEEYSVPLGPSDDYMPTNKIAFLELLLCCNELAHLPDTTLSPNASLQMCAAQNQDSLEFDFLGMLVLHDMIARQLKIDDSYRHAISDIVMWVTKHEIDALKGSLEYKPDIVTLKFDESEKHPRISAMKRIADEWFYEGGIPMPPRSVSVEDISECVHKMETTLRKTPLRKLPNGGFLCDIRSVIRKAYIGLKSSNPNMSSPEEAKTAFGHALEIVLYDILRRTLPVEPKKLGNSKGECYYTSNDAVFVFEYKASERLVNAAPSKLTGFEVWFRDKHACRKKGSKGAKGLFQLLTWAHANRKLLEGKIFVPIIVTMAEECKVGPWQLMLCKMWEEDCPTDLRSVPPMLVTVTELMNYSHVLDWSILPSYTQYLASSKKTWVTFFHGEGIPQERPEFIKNAIGGICDERRSRI